METVSGRKTFEVLLNESFFGIIANELDPVVHNYKKINPDDYLECNIIEAISCLTDFKPTQESQKILIEYTSGILTTYYLNERDGKRQLNNLLREITLDPLYIKIKNHILLILSKRIRSHIKRA
jgi:hypothetical protein